MAGSPESLVPPFTANSSEDEDDLDFADAIDPYDFALEGFQASEAAEIAPADGPAWQLCADLFCFLEA